MSEEILSTTDAVCPKCGSDNIEQVTGSEYPWMHCLDCDEVYWSD